MKRTIACLMLWSVSLPAAPPSFAGRVVGVSDGDTITVLHNRTEVKVRLHGVDAPEKGQPFGQAAKRAASSLCFGLTVRVEPKSLDRYGRTVAVVLLPDARILNHELVRAGYAWWFRKYAPREIQLGALEEDARRQRRGLWAEAAPVPPWVWRKEGQTP